MKASSWIGLAAFVGTALASVAEDLDVPGTTDITASAAYDKVSVSGTLNIAAPYVTFTNLTVGGSATSYATVNVRGEGTIVGLNTGDNRDIATATVGAGGKLGKITIGENATLRIGATVVAADAASDPESGSVDVLDIGPGTFSMSGIRNLSPKLARVTFSGGEIYLGQSWGAFLILGGTGASDPMTTFEGVDGNPIRIRTFGGSSGVSFGRLKTSGDCDCHVKATRAVYNANFDMNHNGWTYISGGGSVSMNPYCYNTAFGTNVKGVTITDGTTVSFGGTTVRFNNLDATNGVISANEVSKRLYFTNTGYMRANLPCSLAKTDEGTTTIDAPSSAEMVEHVHGSIRIVSPFVCKGLLSVYGAEDWRYQKMDVEAPVSAASMRLGRAATVNVKAPLTVVGTLTLEARAKLNIAGRLTVGELVDNGATITLQDGGEIVYSDGTAAYSRGCRFVSGTYLKEGAETMTVYDPASFNGDICVKGGKLQFSAAGWTEKFWRLSITDVKQPDATTPRLIWLCEIPFVSYDMRSVLLTNAMQHASCGLKAKPDLTAPSDLPAGYAAFECETAYQETPWYSDGKVDSLFDAGYNGSMPHLTAPTNDATHPLVIAMHLKDDAPPIYGYDMVHAYSYCRPKDWTLEASNTGADGDWRLVDVRSNETAMSGFESYRGFRTTTQYAGSCAFVLPLDRSKLLPGVDNLPETMGIRVDGGATLDFTNVKDGQVVNRLTIDAEKGVGTVVKAGFAAEGMLDLTNVPAGARPKSLSFTPTLQGCTGATNLAHWQVTANGKPTRWTALYDGTTLTLESPKLFIMLK